MKDVYEIGGCVYEKNETNDFLHIVTVFSNDFRDSSECIWR